MSLSWSQSLPLTGGLAHASSHMFNQQHHVFHQWEHQLREREYARSLFTEDLVGYVDYAAAESALKKEAVNENLLLLLLEEG